MDIFNKLRSIGRTKGVNWKWLILYIGFIASSAFAQDGDFRLGATLGSKHFFDAPEEIGKFCEDNLGLELEYHLTETVFVSAGRYKNSVCEHSTFIGLGAELESGVLSGVPVYAGIEGGIADGYETLIAANDDVPTAGDNVLMGGFFIRAEFNKHALKLRYMVVEAALSYQYGF